MKKAEQLLNRKDTMAKKFYAVKQGKKPGIYLTWDQCKAQVHGFSGAIYKSFPTKEEAEAFIDGVDLSPSNKSKATGSVNEIVLEHIDGVVCYVDGSYNIDTKEFSYGMIVLMEDGTELKFAEKYSDQELAAMRNVAGEIKGSEAAMRFAISRNLDRITIVHDYEGIARWCLGDWKTNKEGTKAYKSYYDQIKDTVKVNFVKVKGHSNDKYNDIADELAKQAVGIPVKEHQLNEIDF